MRFRILNGFRKVDRTREWLIPADFVNKRTVAIVVLGMGMLTELTRRWLPCPGYVTMSRRSFTISANLPASRGLAAVIYCHLGSARFE